MVLVSHTMPQVSKICSDLIVLTGGEAVFSFIRNFKWHQSTIITCSNMKPGNFIGSSQAELEMIWLTSGDKDSRTSDSFEINHGDDLTVHLSIKLKEPLINPHIGLMFYDKEQRNFGEVFNFSDLRRAARLRSARSRARRETRRWRRHSRGRGRRQLARLLVTGRRSSGSCD